MRITNNTFKEDKIIFQKAATMLSLVVCFIKAAGVISGFGNIKADLDLPIANYSQIQGGSKKTFDLIESNAIPSQHQSSNVLKSHDKIFLPLKDKIFSAFFDSLSIAFNDSIQLYSRRIEKANEAYVVGMLKVAKKMNNKKIIADDTVTEILVEVLSETQDSKSIFRLIRENRCIELLIGMIENQIIKLCNEASLEFPSNALIFRQPGVLLRKNLEIAVSKAARAIEQIFDANFVSVESPSKNTLLSALNPRIKKLAQFFHSNRIDLQEPEIFDTLEPCIDRYNFYISHSFRLSICTDHFLDKLLTEFDQRVDILKKSYEIQKASQNFWCTLV